MNINEDQIEQDNKQVLILQIGKKYAFENEEMR